METHTGRRRPPRFELHGDVLCLDFVNTLDDRPSEKPKELLRSYIDLARFAEDTGILGETRVDALRKRSLMDPEAAQHVLLAAIELRLNVPPESGHAGCHRFERFPWQQATREEEVPDAANTGAGEALELCIGDIGGDDRHRTHRIAELVPPPACSDCRSRIRWAVRARLVTSPASVAQRDSRRAVHAEA